MKHNLKPYYGTGFMPKGINYKNYTILVAIANYSENSACSSTASHLISESVTMEEKDMICGNMGSFMHHSCFGTFASAWNRADGSNRDALLKGLSNNEIEL